MVRHCYLAGFGWMPHDYMASALPDINPAVFMQQLE
jgi:hypothetical protein